MKLKANELRLNNIVTLNNKVREELFHNQIHAQNEYFEVLTIYSDGDILLKLDDENVELDVKEIEPILLTEEWFFKFGFEETNAKENLDREWCVDYEIENCNFIINYNKTLNIFYFSFSNGVNWINIEIYYIHQLQNLYFALTNKELEIKM